MAAGLPVAAAELPASISEGARIRVRTSERTLTGTVARVSSESVELRQDEGGSVATIWVASITRIEVSRGRVSRWQMVRRSAVRGALIGAGIGAISLGVQHRQVGRSGSSVASAMALGAGTGGVTGGVVGGMVGAFRGGEQWERVYP